ncbi:MAG: hypothetical protein HOH96_03940 [Flavobacteriales bacterium]|jgi:predicted transcriptional regulator of viral defense system|nr:hypothetical protein [Flavobacteriales bacterium]
MKKDISWQILKGFAVEDKTSFTYQDVLEKFPSSSNTSLSNVLNRMIAKGTITKLGRGHYLIVPTMYDAETYLPNWHVVAKMLMEGKKYYIGYYSAMQIHGLITQPSLEEIIVIEDRTSTPVKLIQGVKFTFVTQMTERFFGVEKSWLNDFDRVAVSDLEKTIVDACTKPHLCGGIVEVARAIFDTKDKIDLQQLLRYFVTNNSNAAIKRYLFLCYVVEVEWTAYHQGMINKQLEITVTLENMKEFERNTTPLSDEHSLGNAFPLLDTTALDEGKKDSGFGLKMNVDIETIKNGIYT